MNAHTTGTENFEEAPRYPLTGERQHPMKTKIRRHGFVIAYRAILNHPTLSLQAKAIFLILKQWAGKDGMRCFPSMAKIAEKGNCSKSAVKRYLKELKDADLIHWQQTVSKKGKLSSCSYLLYDEPYAKYTALPLNNRVPRNVPPWTAGEPRIVPPVSHGEGGKIVPFTEEIDELESSDQDVL